MGDLVIKKKNNGALILVAVDDRQSRIEVGYGLEGVLPDGLTGRIQDQQMLPYFKQGQYEKGIVQGYLTVATTVAKSYDVKLEGVRYNGGASRHRRYADAWLDEGTDRSRPDSTHHR